MVLEFLFASTAFEDGLWGNFVLYGEFAQAISDLSFIFAEKSDQSHYGSDLTALPGGHTDIREDSKRELSLCG